MSAKTKIVVLHVKELIYTGIFVLLGILFLILLIVMFFPKENKEETDIPSEDAPSTDVMADIATVQYIPGIYTAPFTLNGQTVHLEIIIGDNTIESIRLTDLDESTAAMYPLVQSSLDTLSAQIYENQTNENLSSNTFSLENLSYSGETRYTSLLLLDALQTALDKAALTTEEGVLP